MHSCHQKLINVCFTQMSAKNGIKTYKERAVAAMLKEYKQLEDMAVFRPQDPKLLSKTQKRQALQAVNLIKEKRNGTINGRTCAEGRPQQSSISREESTLPTISLQVLLASLIISAYEIRAVHTFDVPGAYLQSPLPKGNVIFMKFEGELADIMCDVKPEYKDTVTFENGKNVLYVKVLN